jgi:divalent metal cation (Fe/Co/Zn/Cd) transporter
MHQPDERFPVGQARLEALGVLACSGVMAVASFQVVAESCAALYDGFARGTPPELELGVIMYAVLGVATALKLVCFVVCNALKARSDSMVALAEDHLNDIASNLAAIGAALLTQYA